MFVCVCCDWSMWLFFFFKQKTAYEMRISDWSSDVCSSDLMAGTNDLYRDLLYPGGGMNLLPGAVVGLGVGAPIILGGVLNLVQQPGLPLAQVFAGAGFLGTIDRKSTRLNSSH